MTTLEERIAEAVYEEARRQGVSLGIFTADHLARAVVAVLPPMLVPVDESADGDIGPISGLTQRESDDFMEAIVTPTADVSDDQIIELLVPPVAIEDVAAVRALLDAQAAAHAAEMGRWKERHKSAMAEVERLNDSLDYANKGKAELEAEVEALRAEALRGGPA